MSAVCITGDVVAQSVVLYMSASTLFARLTSKQQQIIESGIAKNSAEQSVLVSSLSGRRWKGAVGNAEVEKAAAD